MSGLMTAYRSIPVDGAEESHDPVDLAHRDLVIAILTLAVEEEGIQYLTSEDGEYWLGLIGLGGEAIQTRILHRMHKVESQEAMR